MFNFVSNLIAVSKDRKDFAEKGVEEIERRLLVGDCFNDVAAMDAGSLRQIFDALRGVSKSTASYIPAPLPQKKRNGEKKFKR